MSSALSKAYKLLTGTEPAAEMPEWQVAKIISARWDTRVLGEELARECIFRIVNHTIFPDPEVTREIVGQAEERATELFPELEGVDPHMDVIAHLERQYHERAGQEREMLKFK